MEDALGGVETVKHATSTNASHQDATHQDTSATRRNGINERDPMARLDGRLHMYIMCTHVAYPRCPHFVLQLAYRYLKCLKLLLKENLPNSGHNPLAC